MGPHGGQVFGFLGIKVAPLDVVLYRCYFLVNLFTIKRNCGVVEKSEHPKEVSRFGS